MTGPGDQYSQMCKLAKIEKPDFSSQFNSQKFEIMHIREIWSPDLLDFFLPGFLHQLHGVSTEFELDLSGNRSRETFAPR